ncbi:hypothetical protein [Nocardia huaxiensis]|uniref:WXG100 family type VII secretion target n=1 Tax=Nocardia huaxiensis TaxID=2755382 RepID=A0A7D6VDV2_9NOCA|nr:hypothetical protein [Nocardia huaxiensis]QLY32773.1 hypothetical protein H0264_11415 [Nocardia huaxiensis]UFS93491.1 hypothetical protein LPY97_21960 [Nocardia huaxiensis]
MGDEDLRTLSVRPADLRDWAIAVDEMYEDVNLKIGESDRAIREDVKTAWVEDASAALGAFDTYLVGRREDIKRQMAELAEYLRTSANELEASSNQTGERLMGSSLNLPEN